MAIPAVRRSRLRWPLLPGTRVPARRRRTPPAASRSPSAARRRGAGAGQIQRRVRLTQPEAPDLFLPSFAETSWPSRIVGRGETALARLATWALDLVGRLAARAEPASTSVADQGGAAMNEIAVECSELDGGWLGRMTVSDHVSSREFARSACPSSARTSRSTVPRCGRSVVMASKESATALSASRTRYPAGSRIRRSSFRALGSSSGHQHAGRPLGEKGSIVAIRSASC